MRGPSTGLIGADVPALAAAAGRLGEIDLAACRRHVAERFSSRAMARAYEGVILAALSTPRRRLASRVPTPASPSAPGVRA